MRSVILCEVNGEYIAGFTAGEGCFHIGVEYKKNAPRPQIRAMFTIQLRADDVSVLEQIKDYLKCGNINVYERKNGQRAACYRVGRKKDLVNIIIPFFERYPLRAKKQQDFYIWKIVVGMIDNDYHLCDDGVKKILEFKKMMNN
ncbi:MAG: LAGLIDADG family homing endonuclease [Bacteroidales bacterium]|nr:LAGLIDADG family homing endonuclease [Bacteroidales bacterium]